MHRIRNPAYGSSRIGGSNPPLSASERFQEVRRRPANRDQSPVNRGFFVSTRRQAAAPGRIVTSCAARVRVRCASAIDRSGHPGRGGLARDAGPGGARPTPGCLDPARILRRRGSAEDRLAGDRTWALLPGMDGLHVCLSHGRANRRNAPQLPPCPGSASDRGGTGLAEWATGDEEREA